MAFPIFLAKQHPRVRNVSKLGKLMMRRNVVVNAVASEWDLTAMVSEFLFPVAESFRCEFPQQIPMDLL